MQEVMNFLTQKKVSDIEVSSALFGVDWNEILFEEVYKFYMSNRRSANPKVKTYGDISGSKKKRRQQKGTGRARMRTFRAPQYRGGVVLHGPTGRDYSYTIPANKRKIAFAMALSKKHRDGKLVFVDELKLNTSKTKAFVGLMKEWGVSSATMISGLGDKMTYLSQRNLKKFAFFDVKNVSLMELIRSDEKLFLDDSARLFLESKYQRGLV